MYICVSVAMTPRERKKENQKSDALTKSAALEYKLAALCILSLLSLMLIGDAVTFNFPWSIEHLIVVHTQHYWWPCHVLWSRTKCVEWKTEMALKYLLNKNSNYLIPSPFLTHMNTNASLCNDWWPNVKVTVASERQNWKRCFLGKFVSD